MIRFVSVLLIATVITGCSPFSDDVENYAKTKSDGGSMTLLLSRCVDVETMGRRC